MLSIRCFKFRALFFLLDPCAYWMMKSTQIDSLYILWDSFNNNFHPDLLTSWTLRKIETIWLSREWPFLWTKRTRLSLKSIKIVFMLFQDLLLDRICRFFLYWFFGCNMDIPLVFRNLAGENRLYVCPRGQFFNF